ncbi:MAG: branched-chain amino acid ABC transporter permease [Desulfobacteraceae bacterium]|nr:branched-chain amino acid ABC transporter permease [Desulfobacteraceae bacterium]
MSPVTVLYVTQAIHGLVYGMLLFLVASGLTLIYGMMGFLNLSHAFFFMLAAYLSYTFLEITNNFWISLLIAPVIVGIIGMLVERFFLRNLDQGALGYIGQILPTLGVALLILTAVTLFWGSQQPGITIPKSLAGFTSIAGLNYPIYRLFIMCLSFVILAIMSLILFKTRLGLIVRAAVSDADMVSALGIKIPLVFTLVFGIGTWMAGVAGVAAAPMFAVNAGFGYQWSLEAFVVVIVGGLGSLLGAFVAALVFGELHSFGIQLIPRLVPVLMFLIMVLVLSFKPMGFFGKRE